jgi:hypothetical protein
MTPDDLRRCAEVATSVLHPARHDDWSVPAGGLEWDCRSTLEHVLDTLVLYTAHLATRTDRALPYLRRGAVEAPVRHLVRNITSAAWVLAGVAEATPPGTLAYHPAGNSDAEGFCAMAGDELLVHVNDIAEGLGLRFRGWPVARAGAAPGRAPGVGARRRHASRCRMTLFATDANAKRHHTRGPPSKALEDREGRGSGPRPPGPSRADGRWLNRARRHTPTLPIPVAPACPRWRKSPEAIWANAEDTPRFRLHEAPESGEAHARLPRTGRAPSAVAQVARRGTPPPPTPNAKRRGGRMPIGAVPVRTLDRATTGHSRRPASGPGPPPSTDPRALRGDGAGGDP